MIQTAGRMNHGGLLIRRISLQAFCLKESQQHIAYDRNNNGDTQKHVVGFIAVALCIDFFRFIRVVLDLNGLSDLICVRDIRFCVFAGVFCSVHRIGNNRSIFGGHERDEAFFDVFDHSVGRGGTAFFLSRTGDHVFDDDDQEYERDEPENHGGQNHMGIHLSCKIGGCVTQADIIICALSA